MCLHAPHRPDGNLIPPKILKPLCRQLRVFHRMLDVAMSQEELDRPRILLVVGELIPTPMPELMRVYGESQRSALACLGKQLAHAGSGQRAFALGEKDVRGLARQALEFPERTNLDAGQRVCAGHTVLDAPHMKEALI